MKVSVIMPLYNVQDKVHRSLKSVLSQTIQDIEIICVDDCSTDNTVSIVKNLSKHDSRIRIASTQHNSGPGKARNIGIAMAQGETIRFVDSDDTIPKNSLQLLYDALKMTGACCVRGGYVHHALDGSTRTIFPDSKIINPALASCQELAQCLYAHWSFLYYRHNIINNNILFPDDMRNAQDVAFLISNLFKNKKICFISDHVYDYERYDNTITTSKNKKIQWFINVFTLQKKLFQECSQYERQDFTSYSLLTKIAHYYSNEIFPCMGGLTKSEVYHLLKMIFGLCDDNLYTMYQKFHQQGLFTRTRNQAKAFIGALLMNDMDFAYETLKTYWDSESPSSAVRQSVADSDLAVQLDHIYASLSWKVTAPLRSILGTLKGE